MTNDIISSARLAPPIGEFQGIEGRRIFAHRSGRGGPAVVFLPGAGAIGLDYFAVQQQVSQFTTGVVYDRGGTGYSDPLPLPRSAAAVATELRDLLRAANITAPYVLAAHSLGAFYAHRFAQLYPGDVAGLVWLDGLHRDWDEFVPPAGSLAEVERMAADPEQLDHMRSTLRAMRTELPAGYPERIWHSLMDAKVTDEWMRVGIAERAAAAGLAAELRAGPGIPDVPVIALTVVGDDPSRQGSAARELTDAKTRMDAALVRAVSYGEQRVLTGTFHHRLCFDRPGAVVRAIRDVVDRAADR
ncbi:alpha/beta fold hydrolase [Nocardia sp. NBC_01329]|uniref:alpha/beta fold hydrolase n=1 Tax=Nocardia sp. NBC_01329 TaxID=2903594 RepID=UPI002E15710B|nr:alpha/beta hydrolase [Nocardia sp. NBC_01329]